MPSRSWIVCLALALPLAPAAAEPGKSVEPRPEVLVEVRFLCVVDDGMDRLGIDFERDGEPAVPDTGRVRKYLDDAFLDGGKKPVSLDRDQVHEFLKRIQVDSRTKVLSAPPLKTADGKSAVSCTGGSHVYRTGVNVGQVSGSIVLLAKREPVETGMSLLVQPRIAADRRSVRLNLKASVTAEKDSPTLIPVEIRITPPAKDGQPARTLTFTQTIQQPQLTHLEVERELTIPDGGTVLLGGRRREREVRREIAMPLVSKIPYLHRLFRSIGSAREAECVLVMVTAKIVHEDAKNSTASGLEKQVTGLMKRVLDDARDVARFFADGRSPR